MKILILSGPNLNLLGQREPEVYGTMTLDDLNQSVLHFAQHTLASKQPEYNVLELAFFQSNHEGKLIDVLHEARLEYDGVLFNPGAYTHYSYALRDAVAAISIPVVEVHLSDIHAREEFRRHSVMQEVCLAQFMGEGKIGYHKALAFLVDHIGAKASSADTGTAQ